MRQRSRVVAIVSKFVSCRVPEHVWMNREGKLCGFARALDHPQEPSCCHWRTGLRDEHVRRVSLQGPQRPELRAIQGMHALDPALGAIDVKATPAQIDLSPT